MTVFLRPFAASGALMGSGKGGKDAFIGFQRQRLLPVSECLQKAVLIVGDNAHEPCGVNLKRSG